MVLWLQVPSCWGWWRGGGEAFILTAQRIDSHFSSRKRKEVSLFSLRLIITSFELKPLCCVVGVMELLQGLIRRLRRLFSCMLFMHVTVLLLLCLKVTDSSLKQWWNSRMQDWHKTPERAPDLHQTSERGGPHISWAAESGEEPLSALFITRWWEACHLQTTEAEERRSFN